MKLGNITITLRVNEAVIGAVIVITLLLIWVDVPQSSVEVFKQGFGALIAWGAGFALGKNENDKGNTK